MIHDYKTVFSDAQSLTASGTTNSSNVIDLEATSPHIGRGGPPIWLHVKVNTAFTDATSATLIAALQTCATSGGTYTSLWVSPTYTVGTLVKGYNILSGPIGMTGTPLRYLKVLYTNGIGSGYTAGKVDAFLAPGAPRS